MEKKVVLAIFIVFLLFWSVAIFSFFYKHYEIKGSIGLATDKTEDFSEALFGNLGEYVFINRAVAVFFVVIPLIIVTLAVTLSKHSHKKKKKLKGDKYNIKSVDIMSLSKIFALLSLIMYLIVAGIFIFLQKVYSIETATYFDFSYYKFFYFAIVSGGFGALFGLIIGGLYNLFAKEFGGIRIKLKK